MNNLFWFILLPVITSALIYLTNPKRYREIVIGIQSLFLIYSVYIYTFILKEGYLITQTGSWPSPIGILLKGTRVNFPLVIMANLLFFLAYIYSYKESYFNKKFAFLTLILEGLLCGIIISNDLFNIYVLIEVATIVTTILIMFNKKDRVIYDGMVFFLLNMVAMIFFLLGLGFVYRIFGVLDIDILKELAKSVDKEILKIPYAFLITGALFKCGIGFMWAWVKKSYSTPSAPSIMPLLLAGVSSKASFMIFIKVQDIFKNIFDISWLFALLGAITAIIAFILAISQKNLRYILTYHSVSQMGLIFFAYNLNGIYSTYGALYHGINHSLFKGLLFITLGVLIKRYKSDKINGIKGVYKDYPYVAIPLLIGALSITGAPFFNGSISKYFMVKDANILFTNILMQIINLGTIFSFVKFITILFGESTLGENELSIPYNKYFVFYTMSLLCIIGGIFGRNIINFIYNLNFYIDKRIYMEKSFIYFIMLILGYLFYNYVYRKISIFKKIRDTEFDFRYLVSIILIFFISFFTYIKYYL